MKKRKYGILALALSGVLLLGGTSCNRLVKDDNKASLLLDADSNVISVGETLKLESKVKNSKSELYWRSNDNEVASVDETGLVTALKVGETEIVCALKEDLTVKATFKVHVVDKDDKGDKEETRVLELVPPTKTTFTQGTYFDLSGLVVKSYALNANNEKVDEKEEKEFFSNPADGTYLSELGLFTCVISVKGAKSASFDFEVIEALEDESLVNVLTALDKADAYKVEATPYLQMTSGLWNQTYTHTYTKNAYYYEGGNTPYGYAYTPKQGSDVVRGVFKWDYDASGEVVANTYYSHDTSLARAGVVPDFDFFDPDYAPTRLVDGYFKYNDDEINVSLLAFIGLSSGNASYINSVGISVIDETSFKVRVDFYQNIGNIEYLVNEIGTAKLEKIETYLSEKKGGAKAYESITKAQEGLKKNNYRIDMGQVDIGLGMKLDIGQAYFTENYLFFDYNYEYLDYANTGKEEEEKAFAYGYFVKDDGIYMFKSKEESGVKTLSYDPTNRFNSSTNLPSTAGYYGTRTAFTNASNADLFLADSVNGVDGYMCYDSSVNKNFAAITNYSDTKTYVPYAIGLTNLTFNDEKVFSGVTISYFFRYNSSIYLTSAKLEDVGTTKSQIVEDFMKSLEGGQA